MATVTFKNMSGSGVVINGEGVIDGMYVNSTTAGTVKLYNQLSATGSVIFNTITPAIGYHNLGGVHCTVGLYANVGGTLDVTFLIRESN